MTSPKPLKFEKKSRDHEAIFLNHYDWLLDSARQHTQGASEEAEDLPGISKRGGPCLRTLLIHGTRSVVFRAKTNKLSLLIIDKQQRFGTTKAVSQ